MNDPDLTNSLVGAITRFRKKSLVIMVTLKLCFTRCWFRFLWWEDHKINNSRADFKMGAHVFGATSSPRCCKRTAADNEENFLKEVTNKLGRNFSIDDLLQSMKM